MKLQSYSWLGYRHTIFQHQSHQQSPLSSTNALPHLPSTYHSASIRNIFILQFLHCALQYHCWCDFIHDILPPFSTTSSSYLNFYCAIDILSPCPISSGSMLSADDQFSWSLFSSSVGIYYSIFPIIVLYIIHSLSPLLIALIMILFRSLCNSQFHEFNFMTVIF